MNKPKPTLGLHHVALFVKQFEACIEFYHKLLGMQIEWQPDANNIYLTSGTDNLALHRAKEDFQANSYQRLDHIGFIIAELPEVDKWYEYFRNQQVPIKTVPKTHRDGARSFYCLDPDGNAIQMIYHPPLVNRK
jgi:catechol 2,3-dioxygenase-like lactoylglutathione lyase family enzyme